MNTEAKGSYIAPPSAGGLYLAGPMSDIVDEQGIPNCNYPAFHEAASDLRGRGFYVVSPAELHADFETNPKPYGDYLRAGLIALLGTAAVVVLPGWEQSNGARLEVTVARALGMLVWEYEPHYEAVVS